MSDITWTNITVRLGDLKPWQDNPRHSTKAQAKRILASFERFGQVAPVAVDPALSVLDGHQRLSALLTIHGDKYEIEARQSSRALTDDERRGLVLALANATGSWNWDALSGWEAEDLTEWGMDALTLSGWQEDVKNLKEFLQSEKPSADAEPQVDRAAELLEKWQVKPGDLWQIGDHRLICGDCTDAAVVARVMDGERARATITDPPFSVRNDEWDKFEDFYAFTLLWFSLAIKNSELIASFFPDKFLPLLAKVADDAGVPFRRSLVWRKPAGSQMAGASKDGYWYDFEFVQVYGEKTTPNLQNTKMSVFEYRTITGQEHGAQKPVETYQEVLEGYTVESDLVFEPFSGTGTNIVACENLRRRCRAIEISPAYVAVALQRMADAFPALPIKRLE
jgi:DNA modification methylase